MLECLRLADRRRDLNPLSTRCTISGATPEMNPSPRKRAILGVGGIARHRNKERIDVDENARAQLGELCHDLIPIRIQLPVKLAGSYPVASS